jgi:hypothetical protein
VPMIAKRCATDLGRTTMPALWKMWALVVPGGADTLLQVRWKHENPAKNRHLGPRSRSRRLCGTDSLVGAWYAWLLLCGSLYLRP